VSIEVVLESHFIKVHILFDV